MFIKCPNCSVGYEIPNEISLAEGRKLKCSSCGHVFVYHVESVSVVEEEPIETAIPENDEKIDVVLPAESNETTEAPVAFLEEKDKTTDALAESFTPVATTTHKTAKYRPSWFVIVFCALIVCGLGGLGFYYTEFLSSDYLLGMNRGNRTELQMAQQAAAARRRNRIRESRPVQSVIRKLEHVKTTQDTVRKEPEPIERAYDFVQKDIVPENNDQPMGADVPVVIEDTTPAVSNIDPIVIYKDNEMVRDNDGNVVVKIKGSVQNPTAHEIVLPPLVHAVAFDVNGRELFRKDIHLTTRFLGPGKTQDIFGSYTWKPFDPSAVIQWIDMSF